MPLKRIRTGSGAPISLILALVYPAMIGAALALAYYGYKHAETVSRPIEELFREESRSAAGELVAAMESRLEKEAQSLFRRLAADRENPILPSFCELDAGPAIESYVVLTGARKLTCVWPKGQDRKARDTLRTGWEMYLKSLPWDSVPVDSFHYFHEVIESRSVLIAYTARRTADDYRYFMAARLDMEVVGKRWLETEVGKLRKNRRVAILDNNNGLV